MKHSGKFENLSQGGLRLNRLIERYETLYTQGRIDALDELDEIPLLRKMKKREEVKSKITVGVMIVSIAILIFAMCRNFTQIKCMKMMLNSCKSC